jgi:membrane fusion protein, multidrug efflux system
MQKMRLAGLLLVVAMVFAASGCGNSSSASADRDRTVPAPATPPPPAPVPTHADPAATPDDAKGSLSVLSVEHQIDVATERDGVVVSVSRDEGSLVNKGDVLGQLDDRALQIEMTKARDDLQVAQNNVKYKEAELRAKTAALKRQQQLRSLGLSSEADLENADFEAKAAEYDMHGWEAMAESSQAEIHRLELEIDQTRLKAPFSGAVVGRYVREGQAIAKGDKCFRISQLAPLQVQFQVPEAAKPHPRFGADVNLFLVTDPNRSLNARVVKISPVVDPASDSYDVTAELTSKQASDLRPGMAVRVIWPSPNTTAP